MDIGASNHKLRLVGDGATLKRPVVRVENASRPTRESVARRAAAAEMHAAASLSVVDVRSLFALDVAKAIDGGRAAILRPERRRELIAAAVGKGLREFDANLIIAIVQDAARRGERPVDHDVAARLGMVRAAEAPARWVKPAVIASMIILAGWGGWWLAAMIERR